MASVRETLDEFRKAYGAPPEGFEDFVQSCKPENPMLNPTSAPELCLGYRLPNGIVLHDIMMQPYYEAKTMVARPTDVLVASYPKTGTTWTEEICYLILHNVDLVKANSAELETRIPFIEIPAIGIKGIEKLPNPRLIKTHLPYSDIPESFLKNKTKIVYITRNPKDTLISFYNFQKLVGFFAYTGTLEQYLEAFLNGDLVYGAFHDHVLDFWNHRNDENILFLTYEGLQKDFKSSIRQIASFLEKPLTEEQVDQVADHCCFDSMKKNPMTNYSQGGAAIKTPGSDGNFMRKGKVGDWKNTLTPEMSKKIDQYIEKHFQGSGFNFDYEI